MSRISNLLAVRAGRSAAAAALFLVGGGLGAAITHATQPVAAMAPVSISRVTTLDSTASPWFGPSIVSVRGKIAEAFGGKLVLDDGSGRVLVDLGPRAGSGLSAGQTITVQGDYRDQVLHAAFLVAPDGTVTALDPHPGHGHGHRREGPRDEASRPPLPPAPPQAQPAADPAGEK
jgi:hypothetical protein